MPVTWCPAGPKTGEREVTAALPERGHHLVRAGQAILADRGFAGKEFEAFVAERLVAQLVRPDRKDEPVRHGEDRPGPPVDRGRHRHPQNPAQPATS